MTVSTGSPLRYPGGKFRARTILHQHMPANPVTHVLSPFWGGGSYELHLTGLGYTVTGYDGFRPLANFWNHLTLTPEALADEILKNRIVDRELFRDMQKHLKEQQDCTTSIEDAAKFFIVNRCSFSGATLSGGFSKAASTERFTDTSIQKVRDFTNPLITSVQYGMYADTLTPQNIKKTGTDFLFLDPPYLLDSGKDSLYGIGGNLHKTFDHELFKRMLTALDIPFLLTYNNNATIKDLYKDYVITDAEWTYGMNDSKQSSEIIITNYDIPS